MMIRKLILAAVVVVASATQALSAEPAKPTANPVAAANNAFNVDFFQQVAVKPGNVFYSPFSMEAAFGMLAAGAKGNTLNQMVKTLHLPGDLDKTHAGFKELLAQLNNEKTPADKRGFELSVANALWGSTTFPWRKEFLKVTGENYGAGLFETNFNDPEPARAKINQWVEDHTKNKIKDLLPQGSITALTRMVLTNAIYFKGKWELEFDKKLTKDGPFVHASGKTKNVPLMHKDATFSYTENDAWLAVELPYKGNETSMIVLLPKKRGGLAELQKSISIQLLNDTIAKLRMTRDVHLTLPRFKVETNYNLRESMMKLGITDAFDESKADLSGLHTSPEKLYVSAAIHKAFVEVNEEGTEAAAATGIVVGTTSAIIPQPKVFKADHPFVFAIRHKPSNTILFFGKVENLD